jgi:hypothetical protein
MSSPEFTPAFIDVFVDANDNAPEGAGLRFKAESGSRPIVAVELEGRWCALSGWSSAGGGSACAARVAVVEDSSAGTALLIYGDGDWGVRITPGDGEAPWGDSYLLLSRDTAIR